MLHSRSTYYVVTDDSIKLYIHASPNAAHTRIDRTDVDSSGNKRLRISLSSAPEKGKANKAMIALLAKKLRLPKSAFQIIAGQQSREKIVLIDGIAETINEHIKTHLSFNE